ncbi:MAG: DUF447 family protein [archaeon]|nr:DUF447 family protein [archaeon]
MKFLITPKHLNEVTRVLGDYENSLCLEPFKLYESIITVKWPNSDKFNTAAMGIRFIDDYTFLINPFLNTDTYTILKNPPQEKENRKKISVHFVDDPIIFAKAALKGCNSGSSIEELSEEELIKYDEIALIKESNIVIIGEILSEFKNFKADFSKELSEFAQNNVITKFPVRFDVNIIKKFYSNKLFQPTNRGDNLAIEAITLTSKLPYFMQNEIKDEKSSQDKVFKILEEIRKYEKEIRRFSGCKNALTACNIIDDFISEYF